MAYVQRTSALVRAYDEDDNNASTGGTVADATLPDTAGLLDWAVKTRDISDTGIPELELVKEMYDSAFAPVTGVYDDVEDRATIVCELASGNHTEFSIHAPKATIFLADGESVDLLDAAIAALETKVIAIVKGNDGTAVTRFLYGTRSRSRQRKS